MGKEQTILHYAKTVHETVWLRMGSIQISVASRTHPSVLRDFNILDAIHYSKTVHLCLLQSHFYRHNKYQPFHTTLSGFSLARGSQGQQRKKAIGFIFQHTSQLIIMRYDVVLKQFRFCHFVRFLSKKFNDCKKWNTLAFTRIRICCNLVFW